MPTTSAADPASSCTSNSSELFGTARCSLALAGRQASTGAKFAVHAGRASRTTWNGWLPSSSSCSRARRAGPWMMRSAGPACRWRLLSLRGRKVAAIQALASDDQVPTAVAWDLRPAGYGRAPSDHGRRASRSPLACPCVRRTRGPSSQAGPLSRLVAGHVRRRDSARAAVLHSNDRRAALAAPGPAARRRHQRLAGLVLQDDGAGKPTALCSSHSPGLPETSAHRDASGASAAVPDQVHQPPINRIQGSLPPYKHLGIQ